MKYFASGVWVPDSTTLKFDDDVIVTSADMSYVSGHGGNYEVWRPNSTSTSDQTVQYRISITGEHLDKDITLSPSTSFSSTIYSITWPSTLTSTSNIDFRVDFQTGSSKLCTIYNADMGDVNLGFDKSDIASYASDSDYIATVSTTGSLTAIASFRQKTKVTITQSCDSTSSEEKRILCESR